MTLAIRTLLLLLLFTVSQANAEEKMVKIQFNYNGKMVMGSLEDNPASREFLAQLPLKVMLEDYGSIEKIAQLPRQLKEAGGMEAITPVTGDIAYYMPWGNLAIFREDFRFSPGLIRLGRIEQGMDVLRQSGAVEVTIMRAENQSQ